MNNVSYVKMALKTYQNNVSYVTFFRQPYSKINKTHTHFYENVSTKYKQYILSWRCRELNSLFDLLLASSHA